MADDFGMGYALGSDANSGNNGGFGDFGSGLWAVIILAILFGRGGFGFGGGGGGDGVSAGFAWQGIDGGIRGIQQGLCDGFYAVNTGMLTGFNGIQSQIASCCCETQRAIDGVRYDMATGFCNLGNTIQSTTRDIIENQNANYRGLMDFLVTEKLAAKDATIAQLQNQVSQANQNAVIGAKIDAGIAEVIRRTGNECPIPAYVVSNPNCCYGNPLGVGYNGNGYNGGCGCG